MYQAQVDVSEALQHFKRHKTPVHGHLHPAYISIDLNGWHIYRHLHIEAEVCLRLILNLTQCDLVLTYFLLV